MALLGNLLLFKSKINSNVYVFRAKNSQLLSIIKRNVFQCLVFGSPRCGKTSFLDCVIGNKFQEVTNVTTSQRSIVTVLQDKRSNTFKYLIVLNFKILTFSR